MAPTADPASPPSRVDIPRPPAGPGGRPPDRDMDRRRVVIDDAARVYIEAVTAVNRPLFDRVHRLILHLHPDAAVSLSYGIPTYTVDNRRLHVGSWQHGVSIYGWSAGRDGGFTAHHPELKTSTGTIQLRPDTAATVTDDELHDLIRAALSPDHERLQPVHSTGLVVGATGDQGMVCVTGSASPTR